MGELNRGYTKSYRRVCNDESFVPEKPIKSYILLNDVIILMNVGRLVLTFFVSVHVTD